LRSGRDTWPGVEADADVASAANSVASTQHSALDRGQLLEHWCGQLLEHWFNHDRQAPIGDDDASVRGSRPMTVSAVTERMRA
jgi:hypothetical protein